MPASSFTVYRERRRYPGPPNVRRGGCRRKRPHRCDQGRRPRGRATYLLPGFIDAHVHIESSMLVPSEFARAAVVHGTVATVSDPHEIGNVLGVAGVEYMLENASHVPFKFYFGAPSCVPATTFETAGAEITVAEVEQLLDDPRILLSQRDDELSRHSARRRGLPGQGESRATIAASRWTVTHRACAARRRPATSPPASRPITSASPRRRRSTRFGPAARSRSAKARPPATSTRSTRCSANSPARRCCAATTSIPDELLVGHINLLVRRAVERGIDVYDALRAACITPIEHYRLPVGQLRVGDPADFIEVGSLTRVQRAANMDRRPTRGRERQDDDSARRAEGRQQVYGRAMSSRSEIEVSVTGRFDAETASDRSTRRPADHQSAGVPGAGDQ